MKRLPSVSIAVCVYNGAEHIAKTIRSLQALDYPKDKIELLVVDDGSTDDSLKVAQSLGVRTISHKQNKGLSAARNTGLKHSSNEIYICFDHDCLADEAWLNELVKTYGVHKNAVGVGGKIVNLRGSGVLGNYLEAVGYGVPSPLSFGQSSNPVRRFLVYVQSMMQGRNTQVEQPHRVHEIMGGNSSFRRDVLTQVDGWDEQMSGCEDVDICARIRQLEGKNYFYYNPQAKIFHEHGLNLFGFIKRPFKRGPVVYRYYRKQAMAPPIFPLPLAWPLILFGCLLWGVWLVMPAIVLIPQGLYCWWLVRAIREKQPTYLFFPYIQLAYETATIIGLVRGTLS